LPDWLSGLITS